MKEPTKEPLLSAPRRETISARRFALAILGTVAFLIVPFYVCRQLSLVRGGARDPVSYLLPVGKPFNPRHLIRELNPDGKKIHARNVLAVGDSALPKGKKTIVTFKIDGTERQVVMYVPNSYPEAATDNASTPVGMLVLFHGLNDNCDHFLDATGFVPHAEREGFVIASACGSQGYLGTAWNSGMCCGFSNDKPNDIGFAKAIVQSMAQAGYVDTERVMAVGFSNGAMLAEVLGCAAADEFRAAASIGGVVELRPGNDAGLEQCTALTNKTTHRTSVLMVHGNADIMVPWAGNSLLGFPAIEKNLAGWVSRNGCPEDSVNSTIHTKTYTNTLYSSCSVEGMSGYIGGEEGGILVNTGILAPELEEKVLVNDGILAPEDAGAAPLGLRAQVEVLAAAPEIFKAKHHFGRHRGIKRWFKKHHGRHQDDDDDDEKDDVDNEAAKEEQEERDVHDADDDRHHEEQEERKREHGHKGKKMHHKEHGPRGPHGHHHGPHHHGPHHHGGRHPHPPPPPPGDDPLIDDVRFVEVKERSPAIPRGTTSEVELVRVEGGAHRWPEDEEFSTTDYIVEFGARIFGRYN